MPSKGLMVENVLNYINTCVTYKYSIKNTTFSSKIFFATESETIYKTEIGIKRYLSC